VEGEFTYHFSKRIAVLDVGTDLQDFHQNMSKFNIVLKFAL
jgi:hypothetical protein